MPKNMPHDFLKMHGLGNDFVIFDARTTPLALNAEQVRHIADRRFGVGCDQLIIIDSGHKEELRSVDRKSHQPAEGGKPLRSQEASQSANKEPSASEAAPHVSSDSCAAGANNKVSMQIYNSDGSEVSSCGNATRCIAWVLMEEGGKDEITIETKAGLLACKRTGVDRVCVDMGRPVLDWQRIPLAKECDVMHLPISEGELSDPAAVSMGNPHLVFAVKNVDEISLPEVGAKLEHHPLFPERTNVSFAQVISEDQIKLRVWERGAGETLACGTAACATLVALNRRGLVGRKANVKLPGGVLEIEWNQQNDHVLMSGEVAVSFAGKMNV